MACFLVTGLHLAGRQSAAYDEVADVGSGYALLRGNWRLDAEHLPLSKLPAALALPDSLQELTVPPLDAPATARWGFGKRLLHETGQAPLELLRAARTPLIWLNVLLIPLIAWFTHRLGGPLAAAVAVGLASLEPLWLAHATIVGSDALASVLLFSTATLAWAFVHRAGAPSTPLALALGCSAALCVASKYYTPPALAFVWLSALLDAHRRGQLRQLGAPLIVIGLAAATFGVGLAWGWPPAPSRYLYGLSHLGETHVADYKYYAFGEFFHDSALYLTRALSVKVSVSVLALAGLWVALAARPSAPPDARPSTLLWLPALGHLVVVSWLAPPMGARYGLPLLPFLFVQAGLAARALWQAPRARWLLPALVCVHLGSFSIALRSSPLSFFNGLGCYTGQIPPCLDDSNVDWGHALPALDELVTQRFEGAPVRVWYYGSGSVSAYVPRSKAMRRSEWEKPYRALYAISLHGFARATANAWPNHTKPTAVVSGAMAVFDLRDRADLSEPPK